MSWALITTQCNTEPSVARILVQKQVAHHLFLQRKKYVIRGSVVERLVPFFPRYIFVQPGDRWREIRDIAGVCSFVRFGDSYPESVTDDTVNALVDASVSDIFPLGEISGRFKKGDRVRISGDNSIFGTVGIFQHLVKSDRAYILLPWFNKQMVGTEVDEADLDKLQAKSPRYNIRSARRRRSRMNARLNSAQA